MRTNVGAIILALVVGAGLTVRAATVPELWPTNNVTLAGNALSARLAELDAVTASLTEKIKPAVQLQKIIFQINANVPTTTHFAELEKFSKLPAEGEPLTQAIRDVARVWLARVQIKAIEAALIQYYTHRVRFPASLSELGGALSLPLRIDPWGEPWAYSIRAPRGLPKLTDQRYDLGTQKYPNLAKQKSLPVPVFTKVAMSQIGNDKTLTLDSAAGRAVIQPGGVAAGATLLHIGDNWALLASQDRLFAVKF